MDPLTIVENRLEQLEFKLGYPPEEVAAKCVVDQIGIVESALKSIGSGRDKITEMNKRIDDLNSYLDPQFANTINDSKMKSNYILTNEPNIRHHCKSMQLCQDKLPVLDSDVLSDIPKLNKSIQDTNVKNIENKEQCDQAEKCIQQMMETWHQVSLSIMENLVDINKRIEMLEKKIPKK